jgi:drug/metabolite transporter (DMT)-like permease
MLGLFFSVIAALCFGFSTVMQKYSFREMQKFSFRNLVRNRLWLLAIMIGVFGILFYLAALRYEAISLVQPMLSVSIIIPVLVGWLFFRERIRTRWVHTLFIIAGVVLLSL